VGSMWRILSCNHPLGGQPIMVSFGGVPTWQNPPRV
jgi:hypothetical protein